MSLYYEHDYETVRVRGLLNDWTREGLLTESQCLPLKEETVTDLRTTNLFLRAALFLFTTGILILVESLLVVLVSLVVPLGAEKHLPILFFLSAAVSYVAAECLVKQFRLFHFGIEEACAVCSVGLLFAALQLHHGSFRAGADPGELLIMVVCAAAALWVWCRFSYWYAFVAAMLFVAFAAPSLTRSPAAEHALVAIVYATALVSVVALRKNHDADAPQRLYATAEPLLWAGLYCSINLVLHRRFEGLLNSRASTGTAFPPVFYWFTWVLVWCLPPLLIARGIRRKERALLVLGAALLVITFISNRPYLGWQRHPWDPMLLGVALAGTAWWLQRWLAGGENGVRDGFTAARSAGKENAWLTAGTSVFSLLAPQALSHAPHPAAPPAPHGEGGRSGGGGAGGAF